MRKYYLITLLVAALGSCVNKTVEKIDSQAPVSSKCDIINDTLEVDYSDEITSGYSIKKLKALIDFNKVFVDVKYDADTIVRYLFEIDKQKFKIVLDSCSYKKNAFVSVFYNNGRPIKKDILFMKDSVQYGFDNLLVNYRRSSFYLNKSKNLLLIENIEGRGVGKAANWKYYQLIDLKNSKMFEYYSFDEKYKTK